MKVLVTGGTGSFGQAFVRRLLKDGSIKRIVVYSRGEHAQEEMARNFTDERLRYFIGDVRDQDRLELALHGIDTVVHAAALKIVPVAEYNPTECIETNVMGAINVVRASLRCGVRKVVALSTDKAVSPINLYGASKLAAEKIFVAANNLGAGQCAFSVVRYGNVYGSRGSVAPLFKRLAADGLVLPLTDERMTRFNITMDEAIDLVLTAIEHMTGREIFVPKIPSFRVVDLIEAITPGMKPKKVGIRPGEKLHECLITEDEARITYEWGDHYVIANGQEIPPGYEARRVPESFSYTSDTNSEWLSVSELKELVYGSAANTKVGDLLKSA